MEKLKAQLKEQLDRIQSISFMRSDELDRLPSQLLQEIEAIQNKYEESGENKVKIKVPLKFFTLMHEYTEMEKMDFQKRKRQIIDLNDRVMRLMQSNERIKQLSYNQNQSQSAEVKILSRVHIFVNPPQLI